MGRQSVTLISSCLSRDDPWVLTVAGISLYVYGSSNVICEKSYFKKHFDAFYDVRLSLHIVTPTDTASGVRQEAQFTLYIS